MGSLRRAVQRSSVNVPVTCSGQEDVADVDSGGLMADIRYSGVRGNGKIAYWVTDPCRAPADIAEELTRLAQGGSISRRHAGR